MPGVDSFNKFNYWLRPSKQVERKILIEKLLSLAPFGYRMSDYRYLGFGSVYYVDFIMFHKFLFIQGMDCVEHGTIPRRMRFNKPYKFITLRLRPYGQFTSRIRTTIPYLVWLDYDYPVTDGMLLDIDGTMQRLRRRSIFLITVDGRGKLPNDHEQAPVVQAMNDEDRIAYLVNYFQQMLGHYVEGGEVTANDLDENEVPRMFWQAITARIEETLALRDEDLQFIQLFNFRYADGCQMLTFGGIVGNEEDMQALEGYLDEPFISRGDVPVEISVPPLTYSEKQWLDKNIRDGITVDDLAFELDPNFLDNYCKFYKQYPTFVESIV